MTMGRYNQFTFCILFLGLVCLFSPNILGQSSDKERIKLLDDEMTSAFQRGAIEKALEHASEAAPLIQKVYGPQSEEVARSYANLGRLQLALENFTDAIAAFRKAVEIREHLKGADDEDFIRLLTALATAEDRATRYRDAGATYFRVLGLLDRSGVNDSKDVLPIALGAANSLARHKRSAEAEELYIRSLRISYEHYDVTSPERVNVLIFRNCLLGPTFYSRRKSKFQEEEERLKKIESETKGVHHGKATSIPHPAYPAIARERRESGVVLIHLRIDKEGNVTRAAPVCSSPVLGEAAANAAKKARFEPTTINGEPVEVEGLQTYRFIAP